MTDEERPLSGDANGGAEREANTDLDNIDDDYSRPLSYMREMEQDGFQPQRRPTIPVKPPEQFRELPQDQGFTVQALMEGAMLVAISLLLAVIGIYAPVISIIGLLLYPLPMAILTLRRGVKVGVAGTVALLALSAIFFGIPQAVLMLLQYGVLGVFLGWCLRSGRKPLFTLGIATLIAALGAAVAILLSLLISGLPLSSLQDQAREMVNSVIAVYQQYGMIDSLLPEGWTVEQYTSYMEESMMRLLPAVLIISSSLMTVLCYLISTAILRRLRYDIPRLPKFKDWRLDWRFSWGLILGLALLLYGNHTSTAWASTVGASILYVFAPILLVVGVAFLFWYMDAMDTPLVMRGVIIFVSILMFSVMMWFFMTLAALDDMLDLRGRIVRLRDRSRGVS